MVRVALFILVAMFAAGCAGAASQREVTVGALYPRSGPQGAGGSEEERGVQLAVEWVNSHGGIKGQKVRLKSIDTPRAEAVPAALEQMKATGVTVVLGSHGSAISATAADVAGRLDMTFFETGAVGELAGEFVSGRNFFRLAPMGANLGAAAVAFVRDQLHGPGRLPTPSGSTGQPLRYAVAYVDDAYGRSVGGGAAEEARSSGQEVAGTFPYAPSTVDFGAVVAGIAASRPDVLFVAAYLEDGVALRKATLDAGIPLRASIGTSSSYCMPSFGDRLGDGAVGLFASDKPDAAEVRPEALAPEGRAALSWVRERYESRHREAMSAPALSGFSNALAVLGHVLPAAGDLGQPEVSRAALKVKLSEGTLANGAGLDLAAPGSIDAGANRRSAGVIWEWVAPRTRAVVWPPAFATHPITVLPISR